MSRTSFLIIILSMLSLELHTGTAHILFCERFYDLEKSFILETNKVKYFIYTNNNTSPTEISCDKNCDFKNLHFNPNLRTAVIVHGYDSDHTAKWEQPMVNALLARENLNVIVVDWSSFMSFNYYRTAQKTPDIAGRIYKFFVQLAEYSNTDLKDWRYLHLIGHSVGVHIVGQTAKLLKKKVIVQRITALDPAAPYFHKDGANLKLDKSYAQFVDVIHTNGAPNEATFGLYEPLGHIDFYLNGGDRQPDCKINGKRIIFEPLLCLSKLVLGEDVVDVMKNYKARILQGDDMVCDHKEAPKYFIKTLTGKSTFIGRHYYHDSAGVTECADANCIGKDCVEMGINVDRYSRPHYHGLYYVNIECNV